MDIDNTFCKMLIQGTCTPGPDNIGTTIRATMPASGRPGVPSCGTMGDP